MDAVCIALNAGSSSLKFAAYRIGAEGALDLVARGEAAGIGEAPRLTARIVGRDGHHAHAWDEPLGRQDVSAHVLAWIRDALEIAAPAAVGHRVVHGGPDFSAPTILTEEVVAALRALTPWAPLHQPAALAAIDLARAVWPDARQVACFDTAFHQTQPAVATRLGLPRAFEREGVRRYGFHGLSCQYAAARLAELDPAVAAGRVIVAHLGAGASLSALKAGRSIDTSMGFSPLDGLLMSTRCGSLDPGVVLFLQQAKGMDAGRIEDLLYRRSGLLGVSELSGDMRRLLAAPEPAAREAVELFVFRAAREAGALASSLAGLDGVVFTGGVGENAPSVRNDICRRLAWLGVAIDEAANTGAGDRLVSGPDSRVRVWVLGTDEEAVIAQACAALI